MTKYSKGSLYERLGGYDTITRIFDRVCTNMVQDQTLGLYFKGHSDHSKKRLRQMFINYICEATGGPVQHFGCDLNTAHKGLGITAHEWDIMVNYINQAAGKVKVDQVEANDIATLLSELKSQIVER
jgi:hemoglobin